MFSLLIRTKKSKIVWSHLNKKKKHQKCWKKNNRLANKVWATKCAQTYVALSLPRSLAPPFTNAPIRPSLIYTTLSTSCIKLWPNVRCVGKSSFTTFSGLRRDVAIFHTDLRTASHKLCLPNTLPAIFPLSGQLLVVEAPPAPPTGLALTSRHIFWHICWVGNINVTDRNVNAQRKCGITF